MESNQGNIKELEQFTYIVSHNLHSNVSKIKSFVDLLKSTTKKTERDYILNGIEVSVSNLKSIINDVNDIISIKQDVREKYQLVYFEEILMHVMYDVNNLNIIDTVEIYFDFENVPCVFTFKPYLHSIFYNLINNSIKYSKRNCHTVINITSYYDGDSIKLLFVDNGTGIDLERNRREIFGLYKRFNSAVEGTGLGLFMVKNQIEAMGGKIEIQSVQGEGVQLLISLPKTEFVQ